MKTNNQNKIQTGVERIDEIKNRIMSYSGRRKLAKAPVYEMWDSMFDQENQE
jgi:hypothetical protein